MKFLKIVFLLTLVINLSGCGGPVNILPDLARIERESSSTPRIKATVGLFIPFNNTSTFIPYQGPWYYSTDKILEAGYRKMLSNVFDNVVRLASPNDSNEIAKNAVSFVFLPELITANGYSDGSRTFTVDLTSNIRDATGRSVGNPRVIGNGAEKTRGFNSDFGLEGRRAMEDALIKTQRILLATKYDGISVTPVLPVTTPLSNTSPQQTKAQISSRLEELKDIFNRGLITKNEYEQKRKEVLNSF